MMLTLLGWFSLLEALASALGAELPEEGHLEAGASAVAAALRRRARSLTILDNLGRHIAVFDPPVVVPANTNLVVTMYATWSYDYVSVGGNTSPSESPTWYRDEQGFCSWQFRDLAELGYPDFNWVTELSVELGEAPCVADLNGDGVVGGEDLAVLLAFWGSCKTSDCPADFDGDGAVTGADLSVLLASWGVCQ